jgi:hypothetical protein
MVYSLFNTIFYSVLSMVFREHIFLGNKHLLRSVVDEPVGNRVVDDGEVDVPIPPVVVGPVAEDFGCPVVVDTDDVVLEAIYMK